MNAFCPASSLYIYVFFLQVEAVTAIKGSESSINLFDVRSVWKILSWMQSLKCILFMCDVRPTTLPIG
ncbi:hypothetical protein ACFX14_035424 [Malus domestica]